MKPRNIAIACGVAGVTVGLAAATGIVYRKQIKSAASLKWLPGVWPDKTCHNKPVPFWQVTRRS